MPTWTLTGIVLRYANYRDSDRILTILTRERGKLSAAAGDAGNQIPGFLAVASSSPMGNMCSLKGRAR